MNSKYKPMTERELCEFFGITRATAHRLRRKGLLPYLQLGGQVFYLREEVIDRIRRPAKRNSAVKAAAAA